MRRASRRSWAACLSALALLLVGCDPGYSFWIRNDSGRELTVDLDGGWVIAPAGVTGVGASGLGVLLGPIEVADATCQTIATLDVTTQVGIVQVDEGGAAIVDLSNAATDVIDALPSDALASTERCRGRVQAAASGGLGRGRTILFIGGPDYDVHRIGEDGTGLTVVVATADWEQNLSTDAGAEVIVVDRLVDGGIGVARVAGDRLNAVVADGWGAAISPDGSRIAYMRGERLYEDGPLVVRDDGGEHQIADHAAVVSWSPDGSWLAYEVMAGTVYAQNDLWVVRSDGSDARRLTAAGQHGRAAVWSPDSGRIAFAVDPVDVASDPNAEPSSMLAEGPSSIVVFDVADEPGTAGTRLGVTPEGGWSPADWSPDGASLLVDLIGVAGGGPGSRVAAVDVVTGEMRVLSDPPEFGTDGNARWSADGGSILFQRNGDGEYFDLWAMDADGDEEHLVVTGVAEALWGPEAAP